jgi:hypothetical protein
LCFLTNICHSNTVSRCGAVISQAPCHFRVQAAHCSR